MKKCPICLETKDLSKYGVRKERGNAPKSLCRECETKAVAKYQRTKKGVIGTIYNRQTRSSKSRGHRPPEYTKKEFKEWIVSQTLFHELYDEWKQSGYLKRLKPSVDRKCDDIHYCMNNIQLMTWEENNAKLNAGNYKDGHGHLTSKRWDDA